VWVDATGRVLGPATSHTTGNYVDADGNFWGTNRITGAVVPNDGYLVLEHLFTGNNCTGTEFVAGTGPGIVMAVGGVYRAPPLTLASALRIARSWRDETGTCVAIDPGYVQCDQWAACYDLAAILTWPALALPGPFAAPLHAEWY
jgi:hypothetical protein